MKTNRVSMIVDLMSDMARDDNPKADTIWVSNGIEVQQETVFDRLWHIYKEIVGNDDLLRCKFPEYV